MLDVRNPDRCQFAGAMQFGKHVRITAICLHTVARFHRNERGGDDNITVVLVKVLANT